MSNLDFRPDLDFKRDRKVLAQLLPEDRDDIPTSDLKETQVLGENYEKVIAKGEEVLSAIESQILIPIPVYESASSVRAAVLRLDPESGGGSISFDLYKRCMDSITKTPPTEDFLVEYTGVRESDRGISDRLGDKKKKVDNHFL